MKNARVCFEICNAARDKEGNPCPVGVQFSAEGEDGLPVKLNEAEYEAMAKGVNIPNLLELIGLEGVVKPEDVRMITPEEYDKQYGN